MTLMQTGFYQHFLTNSAETIDMISPKKKIHATRSGTGLLTTTSKAMMIPAINMIISPAFVALLKSIISYISAYKHFLPSFLPVTSDHRMPYIITDSLVVLSCSSENTF